MWHVLCKSSKPTAFFPQTEKTLRKEKINGNCLFSPCRLRQRLSVHTKTISIPFLHLQFTQTGPYKPQTNKNLCKNWWGRWRTQARCKEKIHHQRRRTCPVLANSRRKERRESHDDTIAIHHNFWHGNPICHPCHCLC